MDGMRRNSKKTWGSPLLRHWALAPDKVFLNHGSFGACPRVIVELQNRMRLEMETEPVQFLWRHYEERLEPSRAAVARFVVAKARDIVFVTNTTTAVNAVLRSWKLKAGDEILTTDQLYNACSNAVRETARQTGAKMVVAQVPFPVSSPGEIVEAILRGVTRRTRLAVIDHVASNTALVYPIEDIVRELAARGVETLVDGAHAPGLMPLRVQSLNAACYAGNLHKWACAPKGSAFLWARPDIQPLIQPAVVSHGNNTPRPGFTPFQDRFDWAGTFDPTAWFCVGPALEWMEQLLVGRWPAVERFNRALALEARRMLCRELKMEPPCPEPFVGAMATLPLPTVFQGRPRSGKIDAEQLALYDRFGIEVPIMRFGNPEQRYFRISAHLYNTMEDYVRLAESLKALAAETD